MKINGWEYYNHAAIPTVAPHESPDLDPIENGDIWKIDGGTPLLARWTTDFDCGYETNWWYVIKDAPFDISELKSKRRYEVNKGIKNYSVVEIDPLNYKQELYDVQIAAFSAYPKKYRPTVDKDSFFESIDTWEHFRVFGSFSRDSNELLGYALLSEKNDHVNFNVLKTNPKHEKNAINAALVEGVVRYYDSLLTNNGYICDGSRSINHETAFQDYLEKYFGFRKAYCKLHVAYSSKMRRIIKLVYPFRKFLSLFDGIGIIHSLNAVIRMEEISRSEDNI